MKRYAPFFMLSVAILLTVLVQTARAEEEGACPGRFVDPITDVCWSCLFPLTIGSMTAVSGFIA